MVVRGELIGFFGIGISQKTRVIGLLCEFVQIKSNLFAIGSVHKITIHEFALHLGRQTGDNFALMSAHDNYTQRKNKIKNIMRDPVFSSFVRTPNCDRRTDGRTSRRTLDDSIYRASIVSRWNGSRDSDCAFLVMAYHTHDRTCSDLPMYQKSIASGVHQIAKATLNMQTMVGFGG